MATAASSPAAVPGSFSPTSAVRTSCSRWLEGSRSSVSVDRDALVKFSAEIAESILDGGSLEVTEWDADGWHYAGANYKSYGGDGGGGDVHRELMRMERVALYVLTLDAINFCFWPVSSDVQKSGVRRVKNGLEYEHLAVALRKLAEADDGEDCGDSERVVGKDVIVRAAPSYALSPTNLSTLTPAKLHSMLQPHFPPSHEEDDGTLVRYELPDVDVRCHLLNELGRGLLERHDGSALRMISRASKSADALVGITLDTFPGFRDFVDTSGWGAATTASASCEWESAKSKVSVVHFYKRAQIAVADIWAALGRHRDSDEPHDADGRMQLCQFEDVNLITTFPDYRVPQILRHVNVLRYNSSLAKSVDEKAELEKSGVDEVSIRAGTVVAVEEIVRHVKEKIASVKTTCDSRKSDRSEGDLQKLVDDVSAVTVDWYLWQRGERLDRSDSLGPHHRVRTTFY